MVDLKVLRRIRKDMKKLTFRMLVRLAVLTVLCCYVLPCFATSNRQFNGGIFMIFTDS